MRRLMLIAVCLLLSCGGEERLVLVSLPDDPGAALAAAPDEGALATVGGWSVSEADLLAIHPVRPGATVAESLEVLVDRMVAVQAGLDGDFAPRFELLLSWRKALARRWVTKRFTEDFSPETISEARIRAVWEVRWFLWDHMDTFYVLDAQNICCFAHANECDPDVVRRCQDEKMDLMENLHRVFVERSVSDAGTFNKVAEDFAAAHGVDVKVMKYAFQYDHSKAHSEQRGYDLYDPTISAAMKGMEVGTFTKVIRSRQGLHLVFLFKFLPEIHKTFDDPEVRAEIAANAFPGFQEREAAEEFARLSNGVDIGFFPEVLEQVDWPKVTGLEQR